LPPAEVASSSLQPVTQLAMLVMLMAMLNLKLMLARLVKSHLHDC
jgi:hypothetical protein